MPLTKVLIANRGEIAIRIARAASALGIRTLAVHAPADAQSLHSRIADESRVLAGPGFGTDPVGAYLAAEAIVRLALESGCDCLHPGYGFLSENPRLAELCAAAGITFVGPPAPVLALFGDKLAARAHAAALGIPIVPGSAAPAASAAQAAAIAERTGWPVMLKAAAGGGGRGMRVVRGPAEMAEAHARASGEAEAAFGSSALFVERLIERPRHVEVQILADHTGAVIHLHERDCSIQLRNQKVVEIAPAPGLDPALRARLAADAVALARSSGFVNAGTVEFLVRPETGEHFFIECNPRIQVEHTVTEQVTGIDLVETQFALAAGTTLAELGLGSQAAVGAPRGHAVQARVVAQGTGTITAYKEPSGPGVRVDAAAYLGYAPPPQYDPLFAKLVCTAGSAGSLAAALDRAVRALDEFHIAGLATNLGLLRRILCHPAVRAGDARTTLLDEDPALLSPPSTAQPRPEALVLLDLQAKATGAGRPGLAAAVAAADPGPALAVAPGDLAIECPMSGTLALLAAAPGARVRAGETLAVISAMKMETAVTAPAAGMVVAMLDLALGQAVAAGQVLAALRPEADAAAAPDPAADAAGWGPTLAEIATLHRLAEARLAPGSADPGVVRQRSRGKLTCRERIGRLLDPGSFREVGSVTGFTSHDADGRIAAFTPSNHVGGWGSIDRRRVIVCADDFTSRGGHSDGSIAEKSRYLDRLSLELLAPSLRLLDGSSGGGSVASMVPQQRGEGESQARESSGAIEAGRPRVAGSGGSFLPGHLGSTLYAEQLATVPVVNLLLGSVVGLGAAKAVLGHYAVMVRDIAQLFVAGPPVVSHAMGYDITKEDLGGWHIHATNGSVDALAASEDEAFALARRFLSYLPSSVHEAPPVLPPDPSDPPDRREEALFTLVPRKRTATFDIRRAIRLMADRDSFFEIGALWGSDQVVGFARFNGHPVGVLASDSRHVNGGALTADGCEKLTRHLDLCDLFHLPILNLVDNPGFAVGLEHEMTGTIRKGGRWMVAFAQVRVPIFTVLMRRSFGVAGNNYATPRAEPSLRVAWPAADVGGIPPEGGIEAAYKRQLAEAADPLALRAELNARIESVRGPLGPLTRFQIEEMIDPRDTRRLVCDWVEAAHRIATHARALAPRPLAFRP